ncbi:uncharacterized protein LOC130791563 [Actinidia eriantha]|uniref:uncharacterized protein LOC130791563 n=1 Tax=Actinidia eriantha TaxID=165200 RepID=UPI00258EF6F5|nr:uncharacterized protein LOC130791563 [Actinidia eriantha]
MLRRFVPPGPGGFPQPYPKQQHHSSYPQFEFNPQPTTSTAAASRDYSSAAAAGGNYSSAAATGDSYGRAATATSTGGNYSSAAAEFRSSEPSGHSKSRAGSIVLTVGIILREDQTLIHCSVILHGLSMADFIS